MWNPFRKYKEIKKLREIIDFYMDNPNKDADQRPNYIIFKSNNIMYMQKIKGLLKKIVKDRE